MNDFLYAHKKSFQDITVYIDADLKKHQISQIRFDGLLAAQLTEEIANLKDTFLNKNINEIHKLPIKNSLPLLLFYRALDEYQGHTSLFKKPCENLICLCFADSKMAGLGCGSCSVYLKPKEFKKIMNLYPGPLAIKINSFIDDWKKEFHIENTIEIESISQNYIDLKMENYSREDLKSLSDFLFNRVGIRFFLRGVL